MANTLMHSCLLFLFVCTNVFGAQIKYLFTPQEVTASGARCLDGTSSGFYFTNASTDASKTKWVIYMAGGGFCVPNATVTSGVDDCYQRAKGNLGSSKGWSASNNYAPPDFASTWNIVVIPYCGGDFHSGTQKSAVGGLYFAGHLTVVAVVAKLKNAFGLNVGTEVLFSGGSAGAMGVFINIDQVKSMLPAGVTLGAFPVAGWFIDFPQWNPSEDPRNRTASALEIFTVANSYVNQACAAANPLEAVLCLVVENSWQYIAPLRVPFFIANSMFDTNQLNALVLNFSSYNYLNVTENQYIVDFGATLRASSAHTDIAINGLFLTSDLLHGIPFTASVNGTTLQSALSAWYSRTGNFKVIDKCTTPACKSIPLPTK